EVEQPVVQQVVAPQPPVYYPVYYRRRCFSGDTVVITAQGNKTMRQLQIGDYVLTKEGDSVRYTTVKSFLHRLPNQATDFLWLQLSDGNSLKITPYHFVYRTQCNSKRPTIHMLYANELQEGDCLFTVNSTLGSGKAYLLSKKAVTEFGAYAPLTESGDIIANNVYVSCHGHLRPSHLAHTFVYWMQAIQRWFSGEKSQKRIDLPFGTHFFLEILEYIIPLS
ncbi:unnamed protein product, partial [Gongylonema pulchrum]|uniref:HintN domain-containing protein n=1 Tax=Gongylonema pulchrum TaxID=637853 RepID=A0A183EQ86_9BILA